jgi:hypothetical protein
MCLIIKKPADRPICPDFLENAWRHNCDGWGSFHLHAGRLHTSKGLALGGLLRHNATLPPQAEVYLHLRKATYGPANQALAHPYRVRDGLLLMHNGSIEHLAPTDPALSDTAMLALLLRDMLAGLSGEQAGVLIRSDGFTRLIAPLIHGSMVVLLDARGAVRLGRDWHAVRPGEWDDAMRGIEVSNTRTWLNPFPAEAAPVSPARGSAELA